MFDEKTGGKYADKVDKAQNKAYDYIEREGGQSGQGDGQGGGLGGDTGLGGQSGDTGLGDQPGGGRTS